jgi:hypothetical protein
MACNERFTTLTPGVEYAGKILKLFDLRDN